jgi:glycine cleavage system H protein
MNPTNLKYTKDHEWAKVEGKNVTIGVTEFAAKQLGDVVFVQLPEVGAKLEKGKTFGVIESVKTVSDAYSPLSGKVTKKNTNLENSPELINNDAFGQGWIITVEADNLKELDELMDATAYEAHCATCGH